MPKRKHLRSNRLDFFTDGRISFGNLQMQYDILMRKYLDNEEYEKAAELRDEGKARGLRVVLELPPASL